MRFSLSTLLVALVAVLALFVDAMPTSNSYDTNAQRLARGMPPKKPKRLYTPARWTTPPVKPSPGYFPFNCNNDVDAPGDFAFCCKSTSSDKKHYGTVDGSDCYGENGKSPSKAVCSYKTDFQLCCVKVNTLKGTATECVEYSYNPPKKTHHDEP